MTAVGHCSETTLRDYKARLLRVLVHIQQHLDETLGLKELAALACFSPYHFHRVFKGMLGESLMEHIRRLRLERAAIQLKQSARPVTQIAFDAGYQTHEAFTRAFKAAYSVAPSGYRSRNHRATVAIAPSGVHFRHGASLRNFKTPRPSVSTMKATIKRIEPMRVAFMRHVGPYHEVSATWNRFLPLLGKEGLLGGDSQFIGICHDDPDVTPTEKIRYDACVSVDGEFTPTGELGVQSIPGGDYAVVTHFGPYSKLGETYSKLFGEWLPRSGFELGATPSFELYLNDPESTEPEDLLTDICVPIRSKR